MAKTGKVQVTAMLMAVGLLGWASSPCAADVRIAGQVQAGGGPVANSTVTLWAASTDQPARLAQTETGGDGGYVISASGRH
jgi:hypothetical protein